MNNVRGLNGEGVEVFTLRGGHWGNWSGEDEEDFLQSSSCGESCPNFPSFWDLFFSRLLDAWLLIKN